MRKECKLVVRLAVMTLCWSLGYLLMLKMKLADTL